MKEFKIFITVVFGVLFSYGVISYVDTKKQLTLLEGIGNQFRKVAKTFKDNKEIKHKKINKRMMAYERIWINGKSLEECMKYNKELNNNTVKCRSGYYKRIKVWK